MERVAMRLFGVKFLLSINQKQSFPPADCIEGLRWVQREIANFGGDPSKVTLMGHSSGGAGVSIITMIDASKDLFSQAISMSGMLAVGRLLNNPLTNAASAIGFDYNTDTEGSLVLARNLSCMPDGFKTDDTDAGEFAYDFSLK